MKVILQFSVSKQQLVDYLMVQISVSKSFQNKNRKKFLKN